MDREAAAQQSIIGRLLAELSWEGSKIREYRHGGLGRENVLTAEALVGLDYLPRTAFLGAVLHAAHGAERVRSIMSQEIEEAKLLLLPGDLVLAPHKTKRGEQLVVQPDGLLETASCFCLIEAKRIRSSSFQPEQLAREYITAHHEAVGRYPLLFLILGEAPPVRVTKHGRLDVAAAIAKDLRSLVERSGVPLDAQVLEDLIPETVSWITWAELSDVVVQAMQDSDGIGDPSLRATVHRLGQSVVSAIRRHA